MPGFPDGASVDIETTAGLAYLVTVFAAPPPLTGAGIAGSRDRGCVSH